MLAEIRRAKNPRLTVKRLWGYLRRRKVALAVTSVAVAGSSLIGLLGPYLLGRAIDGYIMTHDLAGLAIVCGQMMAVYLATSFCFWVQSYAMAGASQYTIGELRNDLFARLQVLPLRFFDQKAHGEIMSRLTNDVENVNMVLSDSVTQLISGVLSMVGVAVAMFLLNPILAAVSIAVVSSATLLVTRKVGGIARQGFRKQQAALGSLNGLIEETVTGQRVVKAYRREPLVLSEFEHTNLELRKASTQAQIFSSIGPLMNCINNISLAIVAGVGGALAVQGLATVGAVAAFINYSRQFGRPLNDIANLYNSIQSAIAGAERVFEVIDEQPEVDAPESEGPKQLEGEVAFRDVCFSYDPDVPVLKHIDLHARPGQTVALVGPTGAGKTTIVNLLTRFYEIDSGEVRIDGRDIRDLRKDDLRRQLGIVLQDSFLFTGSVRDNIAYGRLGATEEEIRAAAKLANADQFIHRLPQGYDTPLSERGGNISHGQRQLLAIARAVLANPSILILDEATSSVDTRTERHIQEAMLRLMTGRTSFVIAHRLSTIRDADQILVVNHGEIVERGTHEELLARNGFYCSLYEQQFRAASRKGAPLPKA